MDPNNSNPNPTINLRLKISISSVRSTITNIFLDLFIYSFLYILLKERWMALRARDDKLASLIGGCMGNLIVDLNGTAEPNLAGLARGISNRPYKKGAYRTMFRCVSFVGKKNFPNQKLTHQTQHYEEALQFSPIPITAFKDQYIRLVSSPIHIHRSLTID